jgi:iron-sulfur cluster repair protein YtfE (RIC family)
MLSQASAAPDSVSELLGADHGRLDFVLADVKRLLAAGQLALASTSFAAFRDDLERHIAAEEEVLFPAFERSSGLVGPIHVMREEHLEIRQLMAEVAASLAGGAAGCRATPLAALTARIFAHNGKEERILYPMADQSVATAEARAALVERLREY